MQALDACDFLQRGDLEHGLTLRGNAAKLVKGKGSRSPLPSRVVSYCCFFTVNVSASKNNTHTNEMGPTRYLLLYFFTVPCAMGHQPQRHQRLPRGESVYTASIYKSKNFLLTEFCCVYPQAHGLWRSYLNKVHQVTFFRQRY